MKIWFLFLFPLLLLKCNSDISKDFNILISKKDKKFIQSDTLQIKISNRENHTIDSISYFLNDKRITENFALSDFKLGIHLVTVLVYYKDTKSKYETQITLLSDVKPELYTYEVINEYPHDRQAYTQGLEFYRDTLYESTGLRGKSSIRKVNFRTGAIFEKKSFI